MVIVFAMAPRGSAANFERPAPDFPFSDSSLRPPAPGFDDAYFAERHLPIVSFSVEEMIITRTEPENLDFVFDGTGAPILNAQQLEFDVDTGVRFDLILFNHNPRPYDWQFVHFRTDTFLNTEMPSAPGAFFVWFNGVPLTPQDTYVTQYRSKLKSTEVNLRRRATPRMTFLCGLRYIDLRERLDILTSTSPPTGYFSGSENELYGIQIGGEVVLWSNGVTRLEARAKGGMFYNDIGVHALAADAGGAPLKEHWQDEHLAFAGEANVGLVIPAWPCNVRIGYQVIWMTGVALAPDQMDDYDLPLNNFASVDVGSPVWHGGLISFEFVR